MQTLDLAAIGNCAIASLIDRRGRHVWFCFPRLDGDPVFSALVNGDDPQQGFMDVVVCDAIETNQRYLPNTAVLETTISDRHGGQVRIIDFAPRAQRFGRSFHPPMLIRRIEPVTKHVRLAVRIRPHFNYGATKPSISFGSNHVRYGGGQMALRVTADMAIAYILEEAEFALDRPINLVIGPDESVPEAPDSLAQSFLSATIEDWRAWVRGLSIPFEWQQEVIRSAITLKLCSCEDTGAIVAALTTSIPEAPHTARNWDYRFCWLRDAFFTVGALNRLGATRTMENFIRFIIDAVLRENDIAIAPLYPISSGTSSEERLAPSLSGYQGMGPVRIGNAAVSQIQNDVYGSIVLTAAQMFWDARLTYKGLARLYQQLRGAGQLAARYALTGRCRAVGIPWPLQHTHLLRRHVLGGAEPAFAHRRAGWRIRRGRHMGGAGSQAARRNSRARDHTRRLAFRRPRYAGHGCDLPAAAGDRLPAGERSADRQDARHHRPAARARRFRHAL